MKNRTKILFSALTALFFIPFSTFAACTSGENQIEFLYKDEGIDTQNSAHTINGTNISGLQPEDTLVSVLTYNCITGTCSPITVSQSNTAISQPLFASLASNTKGQTKTEIRTEPNSNFSLVSFNTGTNASVQTTSVATTFTSPWTLNIRTTGLAGSQQIAWRWLVYKINGSGKCTPAVNLISSDGGATSSATDTASFADLNAEGRTLNYIAILALALAAFNSAAFWAWRIVKGTKKEI